MKRAFLLLLTAVLLAVGASGPSRTGAATTTTARATQNYCLADFHGACQVRPSLVPTGAHTYMKNVHWRSWNGSSAVGYGRLIESGGCCDPSFNSPAKIRLGVPGECGNRVWYSRIWINYGSHFHKRYLHNDERGPC
jgi:hypothetical protein